MVPMTHSDRGEDVVVDKRLADVGQLTRTQSPMAEIQVLGHKKVQ